MASAGLDESGAPVNIALHLAQSGALDLAIEELCTGTPADWVKISRDPSGRYGAVFFSVAIAIARELPSQHGHLLARTPRLLDLFLDGLKAFEAAGSDSDTNTA